MNLLYLLLCYLSFVTILGFFVISLHAKHPALKSDLLKQVTSGNPSKIYSVGRKLGSGSNGAVYQCQDANHTKVAIKIFPLKKAGDFVKAINESELYANKINKLGRPDLFLQYHRMYYQDGKAWIVLSNVDGYTVSKLPSNKVTVPVVKAILYQTLTALKLLYEAGICHSDLDQSNIMIASKAKNLVLIDFGLSRQLKRGSVKSSEKFKYTSTCSDHRKYVAFVDTMINRLRKSDRKHFSKFVKATGKLPSKKISFASLLQHSTFQGISKTNHIPV